MTLSKAVLLRGAYECAVTVHAVVIRFRKILGLLLIDSGIYAYNNITYFT